jgi:hypothetical protein
MQSRHDTRHEIGRQACYALRVRTLATRGLARADAEDLGGQADGAGVTETLLLGALDELLAHLIGERAVLQWQSEKW